MPFRLAMPLLSIFPLLIAVSSVAAAWPAFRGPEGDGIVDPAIQLPIEWSAQRNIAWRTDLPGEGWSSPVVGGGRIYLTAAVGKNSNPSIDRTMQDFSLSLLILDADNGELLDTIDVFDQTARPKIHSKNSHASPTPVLRDDRIYVHFGYQGTACLSLSGDLIWQNRDLHFKPTHGNGGSPVLVDNRLIFTCDGDKKPKIVGLDADSGKVAWQTPRPVSAVKTFSFCTPTVIEVDGQRQLIAPGSDCVLALDPADGRTIWDVRYSGYSVIPKPVYHRGLVFVSTSFDHSKMLAIRPTGRGVVTNTHVEWRLDKNIPKTPSVIAHDGLVYSISDGGIALCVDAETGDVVYQQRVGGNFSASPLMSGDHIYFTSEQGVTTVVRAGPVFVKVAENDIGERTLASLAVVDNSILLRTANALYRIGR